MLGVSDPRNSPPSRPYSPAVVTSGFVYLSGHVPVDEHGLTIGSNGSEQTERVLTNLGYTLHSAGCSLTDVVSTTVYLTDISLIDEVDKVYRSFFEGNPYPARTTIEVSALARTDFRVEISAIANIPEVETAK